MKSFPRIKWFIRIYRTLPSYGPCGSLESARDAYHYRLLEAIDGHFPFSQDNFNHKMILVFIIIFFFGCFLVRQILAMLRFSVLTMDDVLIIVSDPSTSFDPFSIHETSDQSSASVQNMQMILYF